MHFQIIIKKNVILNVCDMSILRKKKFYITLMQNGFSTASTSHREEDLCTFIC